MVYRSTGAQGQGREDASVKTSEVAQAIISLFKPCFGTMLWDVGRTRETHGDTGAG